MIVIRNHIVFIHKIHKFIYIYLDLSHNEITEMTLDDNWSCLQITNYPTKETSNSIEKDQIEKRIEVEDIPLSIAASHHGVLCHK